MYIDKTRLLDTLKRHEGLRLTPYRCTEGALTIGYGRNLDNAGVTQRVAELMLSEDVESALYELLAYPEFRSVENPVRREVLINMCFNLGITRLMKFKKMWAAIVAQVWDVAAEEMLDSRWADQVGSRAKELAQMMRTGQIS